MNNGVRLHLVEPQPLLRARLVESLRAAGAEVSSGGGPSAVPEGATLVLNLDGPAIEWEETVAEFLTSHRAHAVVTSSAYERLTSASVARVLGKMARPFTPAELIDFVVERLASPAPGPDEDGASHTDITLPHQATSPDAITVRSEDTVESADSSADVTVKTSDSAMEEVRSPSTPATEIEVDSVDHLRDMVVSAYVDTFDAMLLTLVDQDVEERTAAIRALLVRFADELTVAEG
jgi:hypothetical protein